MIKSKSKAPAKAARPSLTLAGGRHFCTQPAPTPRSFAADVNPERAAAIISHHKMWVNGTNITYAFMGGPDRQKKGMRAAFKVWKDVGIGLTFTETTDLDDAMVRIAFANDGSWSYLGRDVLQFPKTQPTMNIGWDLSGDPDTGVHEIGHTLGLNHEHQNNNAGIVWNEEAVYEALANPPNNWSRSTTYHNIIRKLSADEARGSKWDPDSIMHYPFEKGLILKPDEYQDGLNPAGGLSAIDKEWAKKFYPALAPATPELAADDLTPLEVGAGEQRDFVIKPDRSAKYDVRTFGNTDSIMVLFEKDGKNLKYVTADDDSGTEDNAHFQVPLAKGKSYILRVRMMYVEPGTKSTILLW